MAKSKMKSVAAPKVASYPTKSATSKTDGKSLKSVQKPRSKFQKKSSSDSPKSKLAKMGKEPRDKENSIETMSEKKMKKSSSSVKIAAAGNKGVKRKFDSKNKGKDEEAKRPKLEELSFKERKVVRLKSKSNYDLTQRAKVIWNTVREKKCSKEKRNKLLTELCGMIAGKVYELLTAHDTVRVIQCCIQFGSVQQRQAIFDEVKDAGKIIALMKGKYSKHFVMKMLRYCSKEHRAHIMTCFHGQVSKLVRHREAAEVVELAYNNYANARQRSGMLEEFYGPRFAIFKEEGIHTLEDILMKGPELKAGIMEHMLKMLSQVIEKSVIKHSIIHKALLDFLVHAPPKMKTELIEGMRDVVVQILHTRDGARAAMHCLWNGTTKDRKAIIKSFKTYVAKICKEEFGHMVLLALFDCVDDTLLVRKVIIDEMMKSVSEIADDPYGRKVLLYLISPRDPAHFHPKIVGILQQGDGNSSSKKDSHLRRQELLSKASKPLLSYVSENVKTLAYSKSRCLLVLAVLTHAVESTESLILEVQKYPQLYDMSLEAYKDAVKKQGIWEAVGVRVDMPGSKEAGYQAVASLAQEDFIPALTSDDGNQLNEVHVIEHPAGHLVIRKLLQHQKMTLENKPDDDQTERPFSDILLDNVDESSLQAWTRANRGALILASLLDCGSSDSRQRVVDALKPITKNLAKINTKGMEVLQEKLKPTK